jgi:alanine racemase
MGHERCAAIIDLKAIANNTKIIKNLTPGSSVMAVVKADGYGHGSIEVSKTAIKNGASSLGVAVYEEGLLLRQNQITAPILVLGYTPCEAVAACLKNGISLAVYTVDMARVISQTAVRLGLKARIHIKIDTGMSRLGFLPSTSLITDICEIARMQSLEIEGIFTHFATSDSSDLSFTYHQFNCFRDILSSLESSGVFIPVSHCANSGAILADSALHLDMVRAGIILYGLQPSEYRTAEGLQPAMSVHARVSMVKTVDAGISVSYGRKYFTNKKTSIATIPVGYADGYSRSMSNRGRILINGEFAPVIGTVSMDQFMADVTGMDVSPGDEVILLGSSGRHTITADEIARIHATINYEVVCGFSKRVPRIYNDF